MDRSDPSDPYFKWPEPQDDSDRKLLDDVIEHKCHIIGIPEGPHGPSYSFSVGLFLHFEHPEIIIFGLPYTVAATAINDIRTFIEQGRFFKAGDISEQIFAGYPGAFIDVSRAFYPYYLGTAIWFYRSINNGFPVMQIVWPDKNGKFTWQEGYDVHYNARQPLLNAKQKR